MGSLTNNDRNVITPSQNTCKSIDFCGSIQMILLSDAEKRHFFNSALGIYGYQLDDVKKIFRVKLDKLGVKDMWIANIEKDGKKSELLLMQDLTRKYKVIDSMGAIPNPSNNGIVSKLPLIGNAMGTIPEYTLKGNGDLNKAAIEGIYPELMEIILKNAKNSCTKINNMEYFVDPLKKIIAFMLSCPEENGFTAY